MIILPNGCKCSDLKVTPANWKTAKGKEIAQVMAKDWVIYYRYYDDAYRDKYPKGKLVLVRGMNEYKDYKERKEFTAIALTTILNQLKHDNTNPITLKSGTEAYEIPPTSLFIPALRAACEKLTIQKNTKRDIGYIINTLENAVMRTGLQYLAIGKTTRKDIRRLLDYCAAHNPRWSANLFNHYRKYLSILFKELVELEAVDTNIIRDIAKQKTVVKIRPLLTQEERIRVNEHLREKYPSFHRFTHIFFHSGSRLTELVELKGKDVDLVKQHYKVTIKKGAYRREVLKPIKNIALEFWRAQMAFCGQEDYVFSVNLEPGPAKIDPNQVTRRWHNHVKHPIKGLGIKADFYSLKHLNLEETAELLSLQDAAKMAGHTTTAITTKHYVHGEKARQDEKLKGVGNDFA